MSQTVSFIIDQHHESCSSALDTIVNMMTDNNTNEAFTDAMLVDAPTVSPASVGDPHIDVCEAMLWRVIPEAGEFLG